MCKFTPNNPIQQDVTTDPKTGAKKLRFYGHAPKFNYGFIPRTWCSEVDAGDMDAIDLVDLSQKQLKKTLSVSDYLVLGVLGLIDQGELDVKVLAIEINEAKEKGIRNLKDYKRINPGSVEEITVWMRDYKTWEGKKQNTFIWKGEILDAEKALEQISGAHLAYRSLIESPEQNQKYKYWGFPKATSTTDA